MIVRALTNFEYPASREVRDRILRSHTHPYPGDRGEIAQVVVGQELEAPSDLLESWLERGLVVEANPVAGVSPNG